MAIWLLTQHGRTAAVGQRGEADAFGLAKLQHGLVRALVLVVVEVVDENVAAGRKARVEISQTFQNRRVQVSIEADEAERVLDALGSGRKKSFAHHALLGKRHFA